MDDKLLVLKVIAYIENNLVKDLSSESLVDYSGYSINRLRQKFFNVTGDTPSGYLRKRRLTEASKDILGGLPIVEVSMKYGFSSQDNFTTSFRSYFGVTPKEIYNLSQKYKTFISKMRDVYNIMEISGLKQPPYNATLMGCLKGAADYFDLDLTPAMLYGLTGHAFLINIHEELCPSGPYVWKKDGFIRCLSNLGIDWEIVVEFYRDSTGEQREQADARMREEINDGKLGMLGFLEFQLFSGYDESGFHFLQPWNGDAHSEIKTLSYRTWEECLDKEGFAGFSILSKGTLRSDIIEMAKDALVLGLEYMLQPEKYQIDRYRIGYGAYENWIDAVKKGQGNTHGNWWNAAVWSECRMCGSSFFKELQDVVPNEKALKHAKHLADLYRRIGDNLDHAKDKDLDDDRKIAYLEDSLELEREAEGEMDALLQAM